MSLTKCLALKGSFSPTGVGPKSQSLPGAKVGDLVLNIYSTGTTPTSAFNTFFEATISVADAIQQTSGPDLTADDPMTITLFRAISAISVVEA